MSSNKSGKKIYLRNVRKKTPKGIFAAPVWVMQKTGKKMYNTKTNRMWKRTNFGSNYKGE